MTSILYILFFGIIFKKRYERNYLQYNSNFNETIIILLYLTSILYVLFLELFLKEGEKGMKEIIYTRIQILLKPDTSLEIIITSIFFFF